jgi:hypothetical protein
MSELSQLRADYKALSNKNASPGWNAEQLQAKIAELKAAAAQPPVDPEAEAKAAAEKEAAEKEAADRAAAEKEAADKAAAAAAEASTPSAGGDPAPEQSVEEACADLGLTIEKDGHCAIEMLTGLCGPDVNLVRGDPHRCEAAEASRLVRAGYALPRG